MTESLDEHVEGSVVLVVGGVSACRTDKQLSRSQCAVNVTAASAGFGGVRFGLDQQDSWLALSVRKARIAADIKALDGESIDKGQVAPAHQVALCCSFQVPAFDHGAHVQARHDDDVGGNGQKVGGPGVKFGNEVPLLPMQVAAALLEAASLLCVHREMPFARVLQSEFVNQAGKPPQALVVLAIAFVDGLSFGRVDKGGGGGWMGGRAKAAMYTYEG